MSNVLKWHEAIASNPVHKSSKHGQQGNSARHSGESSWLGLLEHGGLAEAKKLTPPAANPKSCVSFVQLFILGHTVGMLPGTRVTLEPTRPIRGLTMAMRLNVRGRYNRSGTIRSYSLVTLNI